MTDSLNLWTLHNSLKDWTLQGLDLAQAQLVVSTLTTTELAICLVWRSDWPSWQKLSDLLATELFQTQTPRGPIPPPITPQMLEDQAHEITQVRPVLANKKVIVERRFDRYDAQVPCEVIVLDRTFSTTSQDISEGGLCFLDPMPEWVAGYFTVVIKTAPSIELTCMMVEDQKNNKFRAEILDSNQAALKVLRTWLENSGFPVL